MNKLQSLMNILGLDEEPMGMFYIDTKPLEGFLPDQSVLPTGTWENVQKKIRKSKNSWKEI
jgi:hypothetical protein